MHPYYQLLKLTRESTLMIGNVDRKCLQVHQEQKNKKIKTGKGIWKAQKENGQMYAWPLFFYFFFF